MCPIFSFLQISCSNSFCAFEYCTYFRQWITFCFCFFFYNHIYLDSEQWKALLVLMMIFGFWTMDSLVILTMFNVQNQSSDNISWSMKKVLMVLGIKVLQIIFGFWTKKSSPSYNIWILNNAWKVSSGGVQRQPS